MLIDILEFEIIEDGKKNQYLWFEIPEGLTIGQMKELKNKVLEKTDEESKVFVGLYFNVSVEEFPKEITISWEEYLNTA